MELWSMELLARTFAGQMETLGRAQKTDGGTQEPLAHAEGKDATNALQIELNVLDQQHFGHATQLLYAG